MASFAGHLIDLTYRARDLEFAVLAAQSQADIIGSDGFTKLHRNTSLFRDIIRCTAGTQVISVIPIAPNDELQNERGFTRRPKAAHPS
jgi:hypothetical protein